MFSWVSTVFGLFTGSSSKWIGIGLGGLALAILLGWLLWSRASLKADLIQERADRITVQTALDAKVKAFDELQSAKEAAINALADRDKKISEITAQSRTWQRKWQEAVRNDQETRDWAGTPLPAAVRELLQQ
jgi:hypothetical protein